MKRFADALLLTALLVTLTTQSALAGGRISADPGKNYKLTKQHGPWMVMVATFRPMPEGYETEGRSPEQAAHDLVIELRKRGLPAYVHKSSSETQEVETKDQLGVARTLRYETDTEYSVVAGNYKTIDESVDGRNAKLAQQTLNWVKKLEPECLQGGFYRSTPGRPGPLSRAFLTINPMLSPEEVAMKKKDPLLLKLNSGVEYSLYTNKAPLTLTVATFKGHSVTETANSKLSDTIKNFDLSFQQDKNYEGALLYQAADRASQVCLALRQQGFEAYVFHSHYESIVTVGGFENPNSGKVVELAQKFAARPKKDPNTGEMRLTSEVLTLPSADGTQWMCAFDPEPRVIPVPQL